MNDRIRDIAEQAYVTVLTTKGMEHIVDGCYIVSPDKLDKFAESIVRECIGIVENYPSWYGDYRDQIENAFRGHLVAKMKYHFGIDS